jgi:hypothetical protein
LHTLVEGPPPPPTPGFSPSCLSPERTTSNAKLTTLPSTSPPPTHTTTPVPKQHRWKAPPSFPPASSSRKAELQAEAAALLTRIEQAKNRGEDYSLSDILTLRKTCRLGGGITVDTRTVGGRYGGAEGGRVGWRGGGILSGVHGLGDHTVPGSASHSPPTTPVLAGLTLSVALLYPLPASTPRDAIFRAGVEGAMRSLMEPGSVDLGGEDPLGLVAGLAGDLNIPDERGVSMATNWVTGACRNRIVEVRGERRGGVLPLQLGMMQIQITRLSCAVSVAAAGRVVASPAEQAVLHSGVC